MGWILVVGGWGNGKNLSRELECKPKGGEAHNKSISIKLDPGREGIKDNFTNIFSLRHCLGFTRSHSHRHQ